MYIFDIAFSEYQPTKPYARWGWILFSDMYKLEKPKYHQNLRNLFYRKTSK